MRLFFRNFLRAGSELPRIPLPRTPVNKGEGYLAAVRRPDGIFPILDDQLSSSAVGSYREDEDARPLGTGILVEDYPADAGRPLRRVLLALVVVGGRTEGTLRGNPTGP
jgi:hypothetical protein